MASLTIKEATPEELEQCACVIHQGFKTVAQQFGLTAENCPTNAAFVQIERLEFEHKRGDFMYALYDEDRMCGFIQLENKGEGRFELHKIAVSPEFRHKGYGRELLLFAKQQAIRQGAKLLTIGIIEENTVLKNWYLKNGFVHTGTKKFEHLPFTVGFMEMSLQDAAKKGEKL